MVRIGVTGHRILAELDRVGAGVGEALRRIDEVFPGQGWTVISPLAEGADRLVAEQALSRPSARLVVPLPLPRLDYMTDFQSAESRAEFLRLLERADQVIELPPAATRSQYDAAGSYVLDNCDVLVAVWDGKGSQGDGGTAAIVERARRRGLPIAWVRAGNGKPGTQEPTSLVSGAGHGDLREPLT